MMLPMVKREVLNQRRPIHELFITLIESYLHVDDSSYFNEYFTFLRILHIAQISGPSVAQVT